MSKQIEIIISEDGEEVSIDLVGFKGQGCSEITAKLSEAIGIISKSDTKCDFFEQEVVEQQHIER